MQTVLLTGKTSRARIQIPDGRLPDTIDRTAASYRYTGTLDKDSRLPIYKMLPEGVHYERVGILADGVQWIAANDNSGSHDTPEEIAGYISVLMLADLLETSPEIVAKCVHKIRTGG